MRVSPDGLTLTDLWQRGNPPLQSLVLSQGVKRPDAIPVESGLPVLKGDEVRILGNLGWGIPLLDQIHPPRHGLDTRLFVPRRMGGILREESSTELGHQAVDAHSSGELER